ncbi:MULTISPECIES: DJ-1/PfpI family protein [unclassified Streptomyces]|uniref:DJ-1/PfpI family protein n=1 Tax=unclassified Streptomyces TaxID=2593676 RepID=UPI002E1F8B49|nr:DJ-1/PfpI family protein [Streptomyces sp. NBC_01023]
MHRREFIRHTSAAAGVLSAGALAATALDDGAAVASTRRTGALRVHIVMFDGVEEMDCIGPYEVFSAAAMHSPNGIEVRYVTTGQPGLVRCGYGTGIEVKYRWSPEAADVVIVPGGGYAHREGPGVWAEIDGATLPRALAAAPREGLTISSLCTGAVILSAAGLTTGRPCTTHHGAKDYLREQGGLVKDARVVDDGDLVTAGGITSGLDLGLWLVNRELGPDVATGAETMLEYEARGTVWRKN